jgi:hypothetical protein
LHASAPAEGPSREASTITLPESREASKKVASIFMKPKPKSPKAPAGDSNSAHDEDAINQEQKAGQATRDEPHLKKEASEEIAGSPSKVTAEKNTKADIGKVHIMHIHYV